MQRQMGVIFRTVSLILSRNQIIIMINTIISKQELSL